MSSRSEDGQVAASTEPLRQLHNPDEILRHAREKNLVYKTYANNNALKLARLPTVGLSRIQFGDGEFMRCVHSLQMVLEPEPQSDPLPDLGEPVQLTRTLTRTLSRGVEPRHSGGASSSISRRLLRYEMDGGPPSPPQLNSDEEDNAEENPYADDTWVRKLLATIAGSVGADSDDDDETDTAPEPATESSADSLPLHRSPSSVVAPKRASIGISEQPSVGSEYGNNGNNNSNSALVKLYSFTRGSAPSEDTATAAATAAEPAGSSNGGADGCYESYKRSIIGSFSRRVDVSAESTEVQQPRQPRAAVLIATTPASSVAVRASEEGETQHSGSALGNSAEAYATAMSPDPRVNPTAPTPDSNRGAFRRASLGTERVDKMLKSLRSGERKNVDEDGCPLYSYGGGGLLSPRARVSHQHQQQRPHPNAPFRSKSMRVSMSSGIAEDDDVVMPKGAGAGAAASSLAMNPRVSSPGLLSNCSRRASMDTGGGAGADVGAPGAGSGAPGYHSGWGDSDRAAAAHRNNKLSRQVSSPLVGAGSSNITNYSNSSGAVADTNGTAGLARRLAPRMSMEGRIGGGGGAAGSANSGSGGSSTLHVPSAAPSRAARVASLEHMSSTRASAAAVIFPRRSVGGHQGGTALGGWSGRGPNGQQQQQQQQQQQRPLRMVRAMSMGDVSLAGSSDGGASLSARAAGRAAGDGASSRTTYGMGPDEHVAYGSNGGAAFLQSPMRVSAAGGDSGSRFERRMSIGGSGGATNGYGYLQPTSATAVADSGSAAVKLPLMTVVSGGRTHRLGWP